MPKYIQLERVKDFFCDDNDGHRMSEDMIIQDLKNYLDNGGNIDLVFKQFENEGEYFFGTILHATAHVYKRVVKFALSRGANIAIEKTREKTKFRYPTALDECAHSYNNSYSQDSEDDDPWRIDSKLRHISILKMLKKRSLELYSQYGLTPFHLDCAINMKLWDSEARSRIKTADVNAAVSTESPFWPAMTPILIAAKFENEALVKKLLDLGANPIVRDIGNNTPLHYLHDDFHDERLFAIDAENTFGSYNGQSHFHIACLCPKNFKSHHIVKRYLDKGTSPNLPMRMYGYEVGLHLADDVKLVQLLLEYGADVDKANRQGITPIDLYFKCPEDPDYPWDKNSPYKYFNLACVCLLIEAGSKMENVTVKEFCGVISHNSEIRFSRNPYVELAILKCISKLTALNLVSDKLKIFFDQIKKKLAEMKKKNVWNEAEYVDQCSEELRSLPDRELRQILDDTVVVKSDFEDKFSSWVETFDFSAYPIYGRLLRIKTKRKLLEFREKKKKVPQAGPEVQRLFQSLCHLPDLVAETILWRFSNEELDQFLSRFSRT